MAGHYFKPCIIFPEFRVFLRVYNMILELLGSRYCWKKLLAMLCFSNGIIDINREGEGGGEGGKDGL